MQRGVMMIGIALVFIRVGWEVDWGVVDSTLDSIAPESDQD